MSDELIQRRIEKIKITEEQMMKSEHNIFNGFNWILDIGSSVKKDDDLSAELEFLDKVRNQF